MVGAAASDMELGGVPLTNLTLHTGASETKLRFDRPNPVRMERMELRVGAADFEVEQLGNARFDSFDFAGGVGEVTLDFTGEWEGDATARIKLTLGTLTLRLPADIGVRITRSTVLTSFETSGFRKTDGGYESDNWDEASEHLELHIDTKFGAVEVERVY
jgi:predicted membrane protein